MPEQAITTYLGNTLDPKLDEGKRVMIEVKDVSMVFNIANEQLNNLKEYAIALAKRELAFKPFTALDGISLELRKGDVYGIIGTNGSGKSTLLKIIAGVLEPTEGECVIHGNIAPLIELGAGFDMDLTARENIFLNGALLGYSKKFIEEHFDEIVDFAEVRQFIDMPMKNYSSGMVARIAFAIATIIVPEILIVDEVLSVGDFMFQQKCERRINELINEYQTTVLIVSHSNDQIERLCNKAIWIEKGHVRMLGSAQDVCGTYRLVGGRIGTPEDEKKVLELLRTKAAIDPDLMLTIAGESRYGTAMKLEGHSFEGTNDNLVLASTNSCAACMLGNTIASALDCPVLPIDPTQLPDIIINGLKQISPKKIYLMGDNTHVTDDVANDIAGLSGAEVQRIDVAAMASMAEQTYAITNASAALGRTAVLTYEDCTGDLITLLPYIFEEKASLFYSEAPSTLSEATRKLLCSGAFDRVIVLGDTEEFSEECLQPLQAAGLEIIRFADEDIYRSNEEINKWVAANTEGMEWETAVICSIFSPADASSLGPYLHSQKASVIFEDTQRLDSVTRASRQITEHKDTIKRIAFLGGNVRFNNDDKNLLCKSMYV